MKLIIVVALMWNQEVGTERKETFPTMWPLEFHILQTSQFSVYMQRTSWQLVSRAGLFFWFFGFCFVCFALLKYFKCWWNNCLFVTDINPSSGDHRWFPRRQMRIAKQTNKEKLSKVVWSQGSWIRVPSLTMPSFPLSRSQWVSWLVKKANCGEASTKGFPFLQGCAPVSFKAWGIEVLSDQAKLGVLRSV